MDRNWNKETRAENFVYLGGNISTHDGSEEGVERSWTGQENMTCIGADVELERSEEDHKDRHIWGTGIKHPAV